MEIGDIVQKSLKISGVCAAMYVIAASPYAISSCTRSWSNILGSPDVHHKERVTQKWAEWEKNRQENLLEPHQRLYPKYVGRRFGLNAAAFINTHRDY